MTVPADVPMNERMVEHMPAQDEAVAPQFSSAGQQDQAATFGLWVFLSTELLFFGPLFFGYLYGRTHFPAAFAVASRHTDVVLGTINTAILLTSSLAMAVAVAAREAADDDDAGRKSSAPASQGSAAIRLAMWSLAATAALGVAFLAVKGIEYAHEWQEQLFPGPDFMIDGAPAPGAQYFFFLYFAMTGLHALHLAIGIALIAVFSIALRRNKLHLGSARHIRLAGLYWHFVDVVWIFLYPMLYLVGRSGA